jgi:esterase/lipase
MESKFEINIHSEGMLFGVQNASNTSSKESTKKAVIFVHGLTGNMYQHIFFNGSKFFVSHDYTTFRFNFHSDKALSRSILNCTLDDYINDLNKVIHYVHESRKFESIYLIAHSMGAVISLFADHAPIEKICLWDPTGNPSERHKIWGRYYEEYSASFIDWGSLERGYNVLVGKDFLKSAETFPDIFEKVKTVSIPVKIIGAGADSLLLIAEKYIQNLSVKKELFIIPEATHCFDEEGVEDILFKETEKWFR